MNKRYQEKVRCIHLKPHGIYQAQNSSLTQRYCRLITLMKGNNMKNEALILNNLRHARSNYLYAKSLASRSAGTHRIGSYTNSLRHAKKAAQNLYHALLVDPDYPLLCKPTAILDYLRSECSCIT